jgi:hypothetical protein
LGGGPCLGCFGRIGLHTNFLMMFKRLKLNDHANGCQL